MKNCMHTRSHQIESCWTSAECLAPIQKTKSELFFPLYRTHVISMIVIDIATSIRCRIPPSSGRTMRALGDPSDLSFPSFKAKSPRSWTNVSSPVFLTQEETRRNEKKAMPSTGSVKMRRALGKMSRASSKQRYEAQHEYKRPVLANQAAAPKQSSGDLDVLQGLSFIQSDI